jgi:cytochrome c peroxidase
MSRRFAAFVVGIGLVHAGAAVPQEALAAGAAASSSGSNAFQKRPTYAAMLAVGRNLFFDPRLSASGKQSCSSCHDPSRAYGPPNDLSVQHGGRDGRADGLRAVPALRYTQDVPRFTEHYFEDDGNDSEDQGPTGGRTWDGRAQTAHEQALLPLFSPLEMANGAPADLLARLRKASYASQLRETFGDNVLDDPDRALKAVLIALEVYQQSPIEFYPYDSKYDAWLRRMATLTPAEERGMALFNDPAKGNCASCHPSGIKEGGFPQFTDYGYIALGVPRNRGIAANADARFYDLGLCGPLRQDLRDKPDTCGKFRTPSLRNVARREVFFHNGAVKHLEDAVRFYATRDTRPEEWYPRGADGTVQKYDDLPSQYQGNIEDKPPFGQKAGSAPVLSDADVADIVAFLNTLTDGYRP